MNKKTILISFLAALIVIVAGIWVWEKKTAQKEEAKKQEEENNSEEKTNAEIDTSDWETYRNGELGVEIKYPSSKNVYTISDSGGSYDLATGNENNFTVGNDKEKNFIFGISSTIGKVDLTEDFIKSHFSGSIGNEDINIIPADVFGKKGFSVGFKSVNKSIISKFYFVQNNDGRVLDISVASDNKEAEKIYSTFRFINK